MGAGVHKIPKNTESKKIRKGRPSKQQQEKLKAELWKYYTKGYSANYTALKTGHEWHTVQTYFKDWTEELIDKTDFVTQQQEAKARLILGLDGRIKVYHDQIARLESQIKAKPTLGLESLLMQANRNLSSLLLDKAAVLITPTADVQVAKILKDKYGIDLDKRRNRDE